ncbi:GntR family transcriptional regulator [Nocardioides mesophilus]|uniref:GntR family transcriptional regulator n=1 Tax=Nocardioides mesophilus TaxID=433659 RepID=A0A7G9R751_9ACTN|nr:GntR family transcriptional regulator [Nocardioides mesophilus]QNN51426.1 GntR family transcriptional regulator [Nocardioides mesophilus]
MDLDEIDPHGPVPPYEQLRAQIAARAHDSRLPAGTKLPTVRGLAEELGLAANTVAKAYRRLEADGVIETHGRRGTFVASSTGGPAAGELTGAADGFARVARRHGLTLPEAQRLLERSWSEPPR